MHSSKNIILILTIFSLVACGGSSKLSSPKAYGEKSNQSEQIDLPKASEETAASAELEVASVKVDSAKQDVRNADTDGEKKNSAAEKLSKTDNKSSNNDQPPKSEVNNYSVGMTDLEDSASAVDDYIWRQFELAEEYHAMGVIANREASWEEAQYYFEKGLRILAELDIETDSSLTPEAVQYTTLLEDIISDYRVALRSLGRLDEEVSISVLVERFGDLAERFDLDTMVVYKDEAPPVKYDLPVVMNDRVKRSIVYFQTVARDAFEKYLRRSEKYKPLMLSIIREYGLPEDLIYLSLVESGYNPRAYSWARAMGLWQFISSTGRLYDLNRDWWMDERRDPVKSTHAACRFLKDLYKEFGSWELAMAAYNGGPGRVRRSIKKQGTIDFWKLRLKRQTMDYVPLIMAATIIAKDPEKYGFVGVQHEPVIVWEDITIDRCLDLSVVASEIGCSLDKLKELNPELLRRYTPPNNKKYTLKIPVGKRNKFLAAYEKMPSPKETSWVRHKIKRGETVSSIASRYGVSQYAIFEANNLRGTSRIYAGKELIVPVPLDRDYSSSRNKRDYADYSSNNSIYVVRAGDTMWDIARAFGTTVSALRRINYIERGSRIYVGQKLKIPSSAKKLKQKNQQDSGSPKLYASKDNQSSGKSSKSTSGENKKYKVRSGDTLWDIARKYGTTTAKLRQFNGLGRSSRIYPGQILSVSGGNVDYLIHKVRRGETLSRIANRYRTSIARIMANNGLTDPDQLRIGTKLKIYLK